MRCPVIFDEMTTVEAAGVESRFDYPWTEVALRPLPAAGARRRTRGEIQPGRERVHGALRRTNNAGRRSGIESTFYVMLPVGTGPP